MKFMFVVYFVVTAQTAAATQIYSPEVDLSQLGRGFDTGSQRLRSHCLDGSIEDGPANRQMQFRTYIEESSRDILDQESGSGNASVNLWVIGGKAKSEFILRNSETNRQSSVLWSIDYRGGTKVFKKHKVNAQGSSASSRAAEARRELCGDEFIGTAVMGARLYLSASLIFTSEENYRYYKTKVSASAFGGLVKKSKTSIEEVRKIAKGAWFSIQFYQYGGNTFPAELIQASGPAVCKVEDIDRCLDKFQALYAYAFGENGFRSALESSLPNLKPINIIGYSYGDSGHPELDSPATVDKQGFTVISEGLFAIGNDIQSQLADTAARLATTSTAESVDIQLKMNALNKQYDQVKAVADLCSSADALSTCEQQYRNVLK